MSDVLVVLCLSDIIAQDINYRNLKFGISAQAKERYETSLNFQPYLITRFKLVGLSEEAR